MSDKNIEVLQTHLDHWKRLLAEGICDKTEGEETIEAFQAAIAALKESCEAVSREAVLQGMYDLCNTGETLKENPWRDNPHIDAIIDMIENLPPVTPKPTECEDAVSRETVLDYIRDNYRRWFINDDAFMQCVNGIKNIVPVTPKQRTGKWEKAITLGRYRCSVCKGEHNDPETGKWNEIFDKCAYNFCPNCGAKMEGVSE